MASYGAWRTVCGRPYRQRPAGHGARRLRDGAELLDGLAEHDLAQEGVHHHDHGHQHEEVRQVLEGARQCARHHAQSRRPPGPTQTTDILKSHLGGGHSVRVHDGKGTTGVITQACIPHSGGVGTC